MFAREVMNRFRLVPLEEEGRLVGRAGNVPWHELSAAYGALLMDGLKVLGKRGKHVNVLQHLMGFLNDHLSG